jgi:hypothetical protein
MNKDITEIHRRMTLIHVVEAQVVYRGAITLELKVAILETEEEQVQNGAGAAA